LGQEKWDFMIAVMFSLQVAIEKYPFSTETELIEGLFPLLFIFLSLFSFFFWKKNLGNIIFIK